MSLVCHEGKDHYMMIIDEAFCVTTPEADSYSAVCQDHISAIPAEKRSKQHVEGGLDVHYLHSVPNALPGSREHLALNSSLLGELKFSISAEAAREYLPSSAQTYLV